MKFGDKNHLRALAEIQSAIDAGNAARGARPCRRCGSHTVEHDADNGLCNPCVDDIQHGAPQRNAYACAIAYHAHTACPECGCDDVDTREHNNATDVADLTWLCTACGTQFDAVS